MSLSEGQKTELIRLIDKHAKANALNVWALDFQWDPKLREQAANNSRDASKALHDFIKIL